MRRIICSLPLLALIGGVAIVIGAIIEAHKKPVDSDSKKNPSAQVAVAPDADTFTDQDRKLVNQVFDNPHLIDAPLPQQTRSSTVVHPENEASLPTFANNPPSNINQPIESTILTANQESFASLRTDVIRNPDSEQNKATAQTIMEMRQKRVERLTQNESK